MRYKELVNDGNIYCKISKSSKEIAPSCAEPHFAEYKTGQITQSDGHGLSFIPIECALSVIGYGDTLTMLDVNNHKINRLFKNDEIKEIGNAFGELRADRLFIGNQYSLNSMEVNAYLAMNTTPGRLMMAIGSLDNPLIGIRHHYQKLGFKKGIQLWEILEEYYLQNKAEKSLSEIGQNIQKALKQCMEMTKSKNKEITKQEFTRNIEGEER